MLSVIDIIYNDEETISIEQKLGVKELTKIIMNFDSDGIKEYEEVVNAFPGRGSYNYVLKKLDLYLKNITTLLDHLLRIQQ